jgi:Fe-S cluster assembly protein SufD
MMNAEIRQMKTAAELALADAFAARPKLPGEAEIETLRQVAFRDFEARGLPHRRVEEWKYTDLRALMRDSKPLAAPPDAAAKARAKGAARMLADIEARRLVFVDGSFVAELSDSAGLQPGLTIRPLSQALAAGDPLLGRYLTKVVPTEGDPTVALNTALMSDGAVIHVAAGVAVDRPIHLVFFAGGDQPASVFTRSLVVVEEGARVMLVESHEGSPIEHQVNTVLEVVVGDKAHVDHVKITGAGAGLHLSTLMAAVGAHARFDTFAFTTDAPLVRNQIFVRYAGEGSIGGIRGATLLKDRQHVDNTLVTDHRAPGCQSRQVFKTVLDDESRGVFQGRINVKQQAQKTDARMAAHALLLSEEAEANSKPELEIFADDVQCGHGATVGALDQDLLFYLKARGIPAKEAEALLIQAFVGEAIEGIEHAGVREALMEHVVGWLAARGG